MNNLWCMWILLMWQILLLPEAFEISRQTQCSGKFILHFHFNDSSFPADLLPQKGDSKNPIETDRVLKRRHRKWSEEITARFSPSCHWRIQGLISLLRSSAFDSTSDGWVMGASVLAGGATAPLFQRALAATLQMDCSLFYPFQYILRRWFRLPLRADARDVCDLPGVLGFINKEIKKDIMSRFLFCNMTKGCLKISTGRVELFWGWRQGV